MKKGAHKSTLKVNKGIEQPPSVNPESIKRFRANKRPLLSPDDYVSGIREGNRTILSQSITLVESHLHSHQKLAREIVALCMPFAGRSFRIGITGVPGVGKSSFIEAIGGYITKRGKKLAVLAVDPSSERSGGSILGDKTRMESLSSDSNAFIRPSPSGGSLGGVARKTRETMLLCEAAGYDVIFVETVGVGQSETSVNSMVDFFLLLMLAGAGDELQGIKRGIMEMADAIAITKADGSNIKPSELARVEYSNAIHLFPKTTSGWKPEVMTLSAHDKTGLDKLWNIIEEYFRYTKANGYLENNRIAQARTWMYDTIKATLMDDFLGNESVKSCISEIEDKVSSGQMSSYAAAAELLDKYLKNQD